MSNNETAIGAVLRWPELKREVPLSRVTVWRWAKEGKFPRPVTLGPNCSGWLRSEVEEWKRGRIAERDAAVAAIAERDAAARRVSR